MMGKVNTAKLMLITRDVAALCDRYQPDNDLEAGAMVGVLLTTAAAIAAKIRGLPFSMPQIERLARAAQDGLNDEIKREER